MALNTGSGTIRPMERALELAVVHVAVGMEVNQSNKLLVFWVLNNFPGRKLRFIHAIAPVKMEILGVPVPENLIDERKAREIKAVHSQNVAIALDYYIAICAKNKVIADKEILESNTVGDGIVDFVKKFNVRWLVMGAGDKRYTWNKKTKSKKALHVLNNAVPSCKVWFVRNGSLIYTRMPNSGSDTIDDNPISPSSSPSCSGRVSNEASFNGEDLGPSLPCTSEISAHLNEVITEATDAAAKCAAAERDMHSAISKVKTFGIWYEEEMRKMQEILEAATKESEDVGKLKTERDNLRRSLQHALDQKSILEQQVLEQREEKEMSGLSVSAAEIEAATKNFDLKIGRGGYGVTYKGCWRDTEVAIKIPNANSVQVASQFFQEVKVLSKVRHPNIVTLMGASPETYALIYEYASSGNLEDWLSCDGDPRRPLPWRTRIRIAADLCSALSFLHSNEGRCIVHGDVKPSNILLDANLGAKLCDFGICRVLHHGADQTGSQRFIMGSLEYVDPEFLSTGIASPKSDVYSFGKVLLRLLTGKPVIGLVEEVQAAMSSNRLSDILDPSAGNWPFMMAKQLASVALNCCATEQANRPNLTSEIWTLLKPMKLLCGDGSAHFHAISSTHLDTPSHFVCPILKQVMRDPHMAADGYTYEAEAIRWWLASGHENSPMTDLALAGRELIPNRGLRSAIEEWRQQRPT